MALFARLGRGGRRVYYLVCLMSTEFMGIPKNRRLGLPLKKTKNKNLANRFSESQWSEIIE